MQQTGRSRVFVTRLAVISPHRGDAPPALFPSLLLLPCDGEIMLGALGFVLPGVAVFRARAPGRWRSFPLVLGLLVSPLPTLFGNSMEILFLAPNVVMGL